MQRSLSNTAVPPSALSYYSSGMYCGFTPLYTTAASGSLPPRENFKPLLFVEIMNSSDKSFFLQVKMVFAFKVIETLSLLPYLSASPSSFSLKNKTKKL